jgi:hypothetical protein
MRSVVADNVFGRSKSAEDLISYFSATFLAVVALKYVPWSPNHDSIFYAMFLIKLKLLKDIAGICTTKLYKRTMSVADDILLTSLKMGRMCPKLEFNETYYILNACILCAV